MSATYFSVMDIWPWALVIALFVSGVILIAGGIAARWGYQTGHYEGHRKGYLLGRRDEREAARADGGWSRMRFTNHSRQ